ncbi:MAG: phosphocarrier protein HPr [Clostridiales bacterium]|nr:phosphocarrier protein HPr [Clostridiales bacterium]MDN5297617.1 phosphocarrier protein HPr [Clostridiales bacterium]
MIQKTYTLGNKLGIHARPAAELVKLAGAYESKVTIVAGEKRADAKSLLMVMSLGAKMGQIIELTVEGPDEADAMQAFDTLIGNNFNEA